MNISLGVAAAFGCLAVAASLDSRAEVSEAEARQLGKTLTHFGAEAAGNADGSIPPYTGGLTRAPAEFKPGSGRYPDPFAAEKPILSIDRKNMAQYADALTEGTKELMRRFDGFRIDVYPSHRTIAYPKYILDRCAKNAVSARLTATGNGVSGDPMACVPFPIPKNGLEILWNHNLRAFGDGGQSTRLSSWLVDSAGRRVDVGNISVDVYSWYADPRRERLEDKFILAVEGRFNSPAGQAGEVQLLKYSLDYDQQDQRSWIYTPGQRRVRLAPEFTYDTPVSSAGGAEFYDEMYIWSGKPDRFEWELVGKKEMFVPYNTYAFTFNVPPEKALGPRYVNPDVLRWEKHRVWVVEARLKEGKRHAFKRRTYYFDEDSWAIVAVDGYDHAGKIQRVGFEYITPTYDWPTFAAPYHLYDLNKGIYKLTVFSSPQDYFRPNAGLNPRGFTAENLVAKGLR